MAHAFIRLEIDRCGIRAAVIEKKYKTDTAARKSSLLFEDLPEQGSLAECIADGIDALLPQMDLAGCVSAIVFISSLPVSFRAIDLPFDNAKKIEQVLDFELETVLPAISAAYISDFHLTGLPGGSGNAIFSASIDETLVERVFSGLMAHGIKPILFMPKGGAAAAGFATTHSDRADFVFLYIDATEVVLTLYYGGTACAARVMPAEKATEKSIADFVRQTRIGFCQRTGLDFLPDIILCSGGDDTKTPGLDVNTISDTIKRENRLSADNLPQIQIVSETDALNPFSPDKKPKGIFNFCQGEYGQSSFIKANINKIYASAFLLVVLIVTMLLSVGHDSAQLEEKIAMIDDRAKVIYLRSFPDKKSVQDPYLEMKANVRQAVKKAGRKNQAGRNGVNKDVKTVEVLSELSGKIQSGTPVTITRFLLNEGRLVISGSTDNFNSVDKLKTMIESSELFLNVEISSAVTDKRKETVNFKFNIEI